MQEMNKEYRLIKILSTDAELNKHLASRLLLGKGKWSVQWTDESVSLIINPSFIKECINELAVFYAKVGLLVNGNELYDGKYPLWCIWRNDYRFIQYLESLDEDLTNRLGINILNYIEEDGSIHIHKILNTPCFKEVLMNIEHLVKNEGLVSKTLQSNGWE